MSNNSQPTTMWTSLDHDQHEVRLLEVDIVHHQHRLRTTSLRSDHVQYTALSYPWGNREQEAEISVDGTAFTITHNLQQALRELIAFWGSHHGASRPKSLLWCDQICINQDNIDERNHQVAFMGRVYSEAEQVLIWLPVPMEISAHTVSWDLWRHWQSDQISGMHLHNLESDGMAEDEDTRIDRCITAWSNVISIMHSAWWPRAWAYQEFILAREARFLIAGLVAPWNELRDTTNLFGDSLDSHLSRTRTLADRNALRSEALTQRVSKLQARLTKLRQRSQRHTHVNHDQVIDRRGVQGTNALSVQELEALIPATKMNAQQHDTKVTRLLEHANILDDSRSQIQQAQFVLASKDERRGQVALSRIMSHVHTFRCSDPRDLVYAFLGLVGDYGITPNYTSSVTFNSVLEDLAVKIIEKEGNLNILLQAIARNDLAENVHGTRPNAVQEDYLQVYNASGDVGSAVDFYHGMASLKGICVGEVESYDLRMTNGSLAHCLKTRPHIQIVPEACYVGRCVNPRTGRMLTTLKDEVWILFGLKLPVILRGREEVICHATLWEKSLISPIMFGSLARAYVKGTFSAETLYLDNLIQDFALRWRQNWQLNGLAARSCQSCLQLRTPCDGEVPACSHCTTMGAKSECDYQPARDWTVPPPQPSLGLDDRDEDDHVSLPALTRSYLDFLDED